jgi:hypothetical protein
VTLENLATGQIVQMRDSLFHFQPNPDVGSEGIYLHNFWTTEKIEPGATYRFTARPDSERSSEAEVEIPHAYQVEVWFAQNESLQNRLHLDRLRYVAFAEVRTLFFDQCGKAENRTPLGTGSPESETQMIPISVRSARRSGCGIPIVDHNELWIVGSGAPWPSSRDYAVDQLGVPDEPSNISNSVGFLGGVLTRVVPYESCRFAGSGPVEDYCKLRYDAASASLSGIITDPVCTRTEIAGATVELLELNPEPPAKAKVRSTLSTSVGRFSIGALEGGRRYALTVSNFIKATPIEQYEPHTDTLEFTAGQHRTYDVGLIRRQCPSQ